MDKGGRDHRNQGGIKGIRTKESTGRSVDMQGIKVKRLRTRKLKRWYCPRESTERWTGPLEIKGNSGQDSRTSRNSKVSRGKGVGTHRNKG